MPYLRVAGAAVLCSCLALLAVPSAVRRAAATGMAAAMPSLASTGSVGGGVETVAVAGTRAFINEGNTLSVLDVADPARPTLLGSYTTPHHIGAIAVAGTRAFVGTRNGLLIFDVATPSAIRLLATHQPAAQYWVRDVQVIGTRVYILTTNSFDILDVAAAAAPTVLGSGSMYFLALPSAFEVVGAIAYIAPADHLSQVHALDVSDPQHIQSIPGAVNALGSYVDIDVDRQYAFVASDSYGLVVLATSGNHDVQAYLDLPDGGRAIAIDGDRAYLTADNLNGKASIVDVGDPLHPSVIGEFAIPGTAGDIAVNGNTAFVANGPGGLQMFDVSNPAAVKHLGSYRAWQAYAVDAAGDRAFVAASEAGLRIVDLSNPQKPVVTGSFQTVGSAVDLQVEGNLAYVVEAPVRDPATDTWSGGGLLIFDISQSSRPELLGSFDEARVPRDLQVVDGRAYIAADDGFFIVDLSDPYKPAQLARYTLPGPYSDFEDVAVENGRAYVTRSNWEQSLTIFDVSDARAPTVLASHNLADVRDIKIVDGRAFLAAYWEFDDQLLIYDVSDPLTTRKLGQQAASGTDPAELELHGDLALVPSNLAFVDGGQINVVDVSDPARPQHLITFETHTSVLDSAIANRLLVLAAKNGGLQIVQTDLPADAPAPSPPPVPTRVPTPVPTPSQAPVATPTRPQAGLPYRLLIPQAGR